MTKCWYPLGQHFSPVSQAWNVCFTSWNSFFSSVFQDLRQKVYTVMKGIHNVTFLSGNLMTKQFIHVGSIHTKHLTRIKTGVFSDSYLQVGLHPHNIHSPQDCNLQLKAERGQWRQPKTPLLLLLYSYQNCQHFLDRNRATAETWLLLFLRWQFKTPTCCYRLISEDTIPCVLCCKLSWALQMCIRWQHIAHCVGLMASVGPTSAGRTKNPYLNLFCIHLFSVNLKA